MNARVVSAFAAGLIGGLGMVVSGMANPAKVLSFFDFFGGWDPSLALVMAGALAITLPGFALAERRSAPVLAPAFSAPSRRDIDAQLVGGAALFGVGWGMSGLCPGPALAALGAGDVRIWGFVAAMAFGMYVARQLKGARPGPLAAVRDAR